MDKDADEVYLASRVNFPDALVIGPMAAKDQRPILLSQPRQLPKASKEYIREANVKKITVLGGQNTISQEVEDELLEIK